MVKVHYKYNDGGRLEAGFKGTTGDCVVRAISIASSIPYKTIYNDIMLANKNHANTRKGYVAKKLKEKGATPRNGNFKAVYHNYILALGFKWTPTMKIGSGCTVHLRKDELPTGIIICRLSKHLTAVIDGVINDTYDCSREGTRCVYGYYSK